MTAELALLNKRVESAPLFPLLSNNDCRNNFIMRGFVTMLFTVMAVLGLLSLAGCYRMVSPPSLDHPLALHVVPDPSLPLLGPAVQLRLAADLNDQLSWTIHPRGEANLRLILSDDDSRVQASSDQDIPRRWQRPITMHWQLSTAPPEIYKKPKQYSGRITIQAHYSSLSEEARMVDRLARQFSQALIDDIWLALNAD